MRQLPSEPYFWPRPSQRPDWHMLLHGRTEPEGEKKVKRGSEPVTPVVHAMKQIQLTSEENMVAQVPIHQQTTGFVILPCLIAWQILYSSVPPICKRYRQIQSLANRLVKPIGNN